MKKISVSPELFGAIMGELPSSAIAEFTKNPTEFIKELGFDFTTEKDIKLVTNESDIVNLALPFYSDLQRSAGTMLSDDRLEAVSGGGMSEAEEALAEVRQAGIRVSNATTDEERDNATLEHATWLARFFGA